MKRASRPRPCAIPPCLYCSMGMDVCHARRKKSPGDCLRGISRLSAAGVAAAVAVRIAVVSADRRAAAVAARLHGAVIAQRRREQRQAEEFIIYNMIPFCKQRNHFNQMLPVKPIQTFYLPEIAQNILTIPQKYHMIPLRKEVKICPHVLLKKWLRICYVI